MPHHAAGPAVVLFTRHRRGLRRDHPLSCLAHRAELVIARHFLDDVPALVLLERDARPQVVQERLRGEQFADQRFQCRFAPGRRSPRREALPPAGDAPHARQQPIAGHQQQVVYEQVRRGLLVALELVDRHVQVRRRIGRVFEFDDDQRQPVDVQDQVRPDRLPARPLHRELPNNQKVVVGQIVEVDHPCLPAAHLTGLDVLVLHRHAVGQQSVEVAVVFDQRRVRRTGQ